MPRCRLNSVRALFPCCRTFVLACLVVHGGSAFAAIFTVGTGTGCTHGTIQSAIDAANAAPGADTVRVTRSLTYQAQANTISGSENLNLVGGFATCAQAATDNIKTVVSGFGGVPEPVFRITAATGVVVKLRHLTITRGDEDGNGGGIWFQGNGKLEVIESTITNNSAAYGGGIYAFGTGTNAELLISEGTVISNNTADYSGGGVSIGGALKMTMSAPNSTISSNVALGLAAGTGVGGGLQVKGPATAYIASSGVNGLGAIDGNRAINGGGISIISGYFSGTDATVYLYTTSPSQPGAVRRNHASNTGGGVYLQSYQSGPDYSSGVLCASDFLINDNAARDGSAIYLDSGLSGSRTYGGAVRFNYPSCLPVGAVRCASGIPCNTVSGNTAVSTGGGPSDGATVRLLSDAYLEAYRFEMRGNRGGDAIRADGVNASIDIRGCLLANNELTRQLIRADDGVSVDIEDCTITRNVIGLTDVLHIERSLTLRNSIIDQPNNLTLAFFGLGGFSLNVTNILARDISSLPNNSSIISGDPSFIDATNGNYHLQRYSLATDFAPAGFGDNRDLDNLPRDQDLPGVSNLFGPRDLGAYERQIGAGDCGTADSIFCNGFEP